MNQVKRLSQGRRCVAARFDGWLSFDVISLFIGNQSWIRAEHGWSNPGNGYGCERRRVVGSKVQLTNRPTAASRETTTSANWGIHFPGSAGRKLRSASGPGRDSRNTVRKGMVVRLERGRGVGHRVAVGGSTETVEVTGAPPLVDTTSTQLGAVVGARAVSQLPLTQRDTYQLFSCSPASNRKWAWIRFTEVTEAGVVSVNGGRGRDNNFTVNGGDGNDQFAGLPAIQPSPDSDFRVSSDHEHI